MSKFVSCNEGQGLIFHKSVSAKQFWGIKLHKGINNLSGFDRQDCAEPKVNLQIYPPVKPLQVRPLI